MNNIIKFAQVKLIEMRQKEQEQIETSIKDLFEKTFPTGTMQMINRHNSHLKVEVLRYDHTDRVMVRNPESKKEYWIFRDCLLRHALYEIKCEECE